MCYHGGRYINIEIRRLCRMWIAAGLLGLCVTANNNRKKILFPFQTFVLLFT